MLGFSFSKSNGYSTIISARPRILILGETVNLEASKVVVGDCCGYKDLLGGDWVLLLRLLCFFLERLNNLGGLSGAV